MGWDTRRGQKRERGREGERQRAHACEKEEGTTLSSVDPSVHWEAVRHDLTHAASSPCSFPPERRELFLWNSLSPLHPFPLMKGKRWRDVFTRVGPPWRRRRRWRQRWSRRRRTRSLPTELLQISILVAGHSHESGSVIGTQSWPTSSTNSSTCEPKPLPNLYCSFN